MNYLKKIIILTIDLFIALVSLSISYFVYYLDRDTGLLTINFSSFLGFAIVLCISNIIFNIFFGVYKSIWKYTSIHEMVQLFKSNFFTSVIFGFYIYITGFSFPRTVFLNTIILLFILSGSTRISYRILQNFKISYSKMTNKVRLLIIGAGISGAAVIDNLQKTADSKYKVIGLIDDDISKQKALVHGIKVIGMRQDILEIAKKFQVDEILIAIPSIKRKDLAEILDLCKSTGRAVKIMPRLDEFECKQDFSVYDARNIKIEDLLGRDEIDLDHYGISSYLTDKVVLVTGGGGSIGSELCRQIAEYKPKKLVVIDIYENNAYELQQSFSRKYGERLNFVVAIGSVQDNERVREIFDTHKPDVVFHAAAHKHVPLMENDPGEAVKNNIFGTLNVVENSELYNVKKFILVSTDKAVNPTNIMGATKRVCEIIMEAYAAKSKTVYAAVRFGNVLGSNGSVIPLFCNQIAEGGPITLTDERITRYFMTIPEAAKLVIQAGAFANGGEIYVLDMGDPIKIKDLAEDLIRLMGYKPNVDIKIEVVGLRPGEKLHEELFLPDEGITKTNHSSILICKAPSLVDLNELENGLNKLRNCSSEPDYIRNLWRLVEVHKVDVYEEVAVTEEWSDDRG